MTGTGTRDVASGARVAPRVETFGSEIIGILDAVDVPIVVVGRDSKVARFNRAAAAVLGVTPSDIGGLPRNIRALDAIEDFERLCAGVMADGVPCRRDIQTGDQWFLLRIVPYSGSDGEVQGAVLTFANVTALRASIAKAVHEREYTKAILNTVIQPLVVLDSDLCVQTANRAFYEIFGVSREETQGVPLSTLGSHDWSTSGLFSSLRATVSDGREFGNLEVEHSFPGGRRTVLIDARPLSQDGDDRSAILLAFQDITARKQAQDRLRDAEHQLRDFVENAAVGMHWVGPSGTILWANRTELEMLGYSREEYLGHDIAEFHADASVIEGILKRLTDGETIRECEARLRCKDGSIRDVLINSNGLWENGKFIHTRCFTRDITDRKRAELEREEMLGVAERTRVEAERANEAKDNFLAVLSHELRSPMNAMLGWLRILKNAGTKDPDLVCRAVDTLERNIWIQTQVINDLLDVSRIMSGKLELEQVRVDLTSAVTACVESLRPSAEGKQVALRLNLKAQNVEVIGDTARLQQVVSNVLGNAIKFTDGGGFITVTIERKDDTAFVIVEDTGQGIPSELLPHLFERFRQGDSSTSRKHGGLGLGLAIVKNLVALHGGEVRAESSGAGRGARFSVALPIAEGGQRLAFRAPAVPQKAGVLPSLDVLIVEDDADSRQALEFALGERGARVRTADSVRRALEAYNARPPDVIISDIGMPGQDGYVLIRAIREREEGRSHRTLAIAMTGFAGRQDREMALRAGFDEHVAKPVDLEVLLERVRVLEASRGGSVPIGVR